jgi:hypothetical protein
MPMVARATLSEEAENALPGHAEHDRSTLLASAALGLVMMIGAVVVLVDAASLRPSDEVVGPAAAPTAVGILLGALGALLVLQSGRHLRTATAQQALPHRRLLRLAAMVAVLVAFALLLPILGYVVSSAPHRRLRLDPGRGGVPPLRQAHRAGPAGRAVGVLTWSSCSPCCRASAMHSPRRTCCGRSSGSRSARRSGCCPASGPR